ncbi:conserved hypothetical protein [Streptomyces filamentosus NRRL 15998]|uniref:Uncharacterized protein n=1 Tax=Streptomyces filamentosus NRRL 15998 TaxID=457431 RepID=D6AQ22_STRFL|nr:conserved hypothetical protein [Streptomyces filamentosus NRRL 15998]
MRGAAFGKAAPRMVNYSAARPGFRNGPAGSLDIDLPARIGQRRPQSRERGQHRAPRRIRPVMVDPDHLLGQRPAARDQRQRGVRRQCRRDQRGRVRPRRGAQRRRHRGRVPRLVDVRLKTAQRHRSRPGRRGGRGVAGHHRLQTLVLDPGHTRLQAQHLQLRRGVRQSRAAAVDPALLPVQQREVGAARGGRVGGDPLPGPRAHRHRGDSGGPAHGLLRADHAQVDAPGVRQQRFGAHRGDRVQHEQRAVRPDHLADLRDRVGVAGRRLRVHQRDEVDLRVLGQRFGDLAGGHRRVEGHREVDDLGAAVPQPVAEGLPVRTRDHVQRGRAGPRAAADTALQWQQRLALGDDDVLLRGEEPGHTPLDRREVAGGQRGKVEEGVRHGGALFGFVRRSKGTGSLPTAHRRPRTVPRMSDRVSGRTVGRTGGRSE